MKKTKFFIILITIIIFIFIIIFYKNSSKISKTGHNNTSQEIVNNILNISSYETTIQVDIEGNKNQTKYILKQSYKAPDTSIQEIIEPSNIAGIKIIKEGEKLTLQNTSLNLSTIIENYKYISNNVLDLNDFIENYKNDQKATYKEKDEIIMQTTTNNLEKELYINKKTELPTKLEIKDNSKKSKIYILYNEVNIK